MTMPLAASCRPVRLLGCADISVPGMYPIFIGSIHNDHSWSLNGDCRASLYPIEIYFQRLNPIRAGLALGWAAAGAGAEPLKGLDPACDSGEAANSKWAMSGLAMLPRERVKTKAAQRHVGPQSVTPCAGNRYR